MGPLRAGPCMLKENRSYELELNWLAGLSQQMNVHQGGI